jgi:hypothetical protein
VISNLNDEVKEALQKADHLLATGLALAPHQRDSASLVKHFNYLQSLRRRVQISLRERELSMSLSQAMLALNDSLPGMPHVEPADHLKTLYNINVVVSGQPEMLSDVTFKQRFVTTMARACDIGLKLHADPTYWEHLHREEGRKRRFLQRLDKVCYAFVEHGNSADPAAGPILKKASAYLTERGIEHIPKECRMDQPEREASVVGLFPRVFCTLKKTFQRLVKG